MPKKHFKFLFLSLFIVFFLSSTASAEYALEIPLTGSSPDGYQISFTLPWKTGMSSDFSNIRFYEENTRLSGGTELPYWIEKYTTSSSAIVWIPIPANAATIYCQWDITGETASESNGKKVFPVLFDDFTDGYLNTSVWTAIKKGSESAVISTSTNLGGYAQLKGAAGTVSSANIVSTTTVNRPFVLEYESMCYDTSYPDTSIGSGDLQDSEGTNTGWWHTTLSDGYLFSSQDTATSQIIRTPAGTSNVLLYTPNSNIFYPTVYEKYRHIIQLSDTNITTQRAYDDVWTTTADLSDSTYSDNLKIALSQGEYSNGKGDTRSIFWVFVRQYDATPVTATVSTTVLSSPIPDFSGTPTNGVSPTSVVFSDLSTGSPVTWLWDFGDESTSTTQNPTHTYTAAGNYTVSLTTGNSYGEATATKTNYINISAPATAPVVNWTTNGNSGTIPLTVQFTDTSTENPTSWSWSFGDGSTSTAQNPTHTYTTAGSFTVTLTATNALGASTGTKANLITTSYPVPVASFSSRKTSFYEWTFTDTSTGYATSYSWNFGDGSTSTTRNPTHNYGKNGTYTITLTVSNPAGSDSASQTIQMLAQEGDAEISTSSDNVLLLDENTSYTFNVSSNITLDHTEFWVNGDLFTVEGNEMTYNFTEGGVYYNVTAFGVSASGNYSTPVTWRVTVHRGRASTHMEKFDETNYNYLVDNITHFNSTNIAEVSMLPFTNLMGRAFYLILFVMPFALLWMKQRMLTIPVVMALITGCLLISFIPTQYMGFLTYAVILSFAVALYLLGRERF